MTLKISKCKRTNAVELIYIHLPALFNFSEVLKSILVIKLFFISKSGFAHMLWDVIACSPVSVDDLETDLGEILGRTSQIRERR